MKKTNDIKFIYIGAIICLILNVMLRIIYILTGEKSLIIPLGMTYSNYAFIALGFILIIVFIINLCEKKEKNTFKLLTIMLLLFGGYIVNTQLIAKKIFITKEDKYILQVKKLISQIKEDKSGKKIYRLNDMQEIDSSFVKSPFELNLDESSYIFNFENKSHVCISDGDQIIEGSINHLNYKNSTLHNKCEFEFTYDEAKFYIPEVLNSKYQKEFEVKSCSRPSSPIFGTDEKYLSCYVLEKGQEKEYYVHLYNDLEFYDSYLENFNK